MSTMPKLFATDLDGTLVDRSGKVHDKDREAIAELVRRGVIVTIVTGRMYSGTRDVAGSLGLGGPICCIDGSAIVRVDGDRHLVSCPIPRDAGPVLRTALAASGAAAFVLAGDEIVHDARGAAFAAYLRTWTPRVARVDDVAALLGPEANADVAALIAVGTETEIHALASGIGGAVPGLVAAPTFPISREEFRGRWAMLARAAGATKGSALEWIAAHHGVAMRDVVAVGDWLNDVSMFRVAGRSFAMAHAPGDVKAAATHTLRADATTGGGLAEAAERAGLL